MAKTAEPKYDLFISYSHKDFPFVDKLARKLERSDVLVWYDRGALRLGETFSREIEKALEQSRYFLLVISPDYLAGQWSNFEMGVALSHSSASEPRIIPLYLGEAPLSALPPSIKQMQGLFARDSTIEQLAREVVKIIKRPDQCERVS